MVQASPHVAVWQLWSRIPCEEPPKLTPEQVSETVKADYVYS